MKKNELTMFTIEDEMLIEFICKRIDQGWICLSGDILELADEIEKKFIPDKGHLFNLVVGPDLSIIVLFKNIEGIEAVFNKGEYCRLFQIARKEKLGFYMIAIATGKQGKSRMTLFRISVSKELWDKVDETLRKEKKTWESMTSEMQRNERVES